jgi:SAM-dependent methyltransferase
MSAKAAPYLQPYERAAAVHGEGFGSLLWASPATQAARFDAMIGLAEFRERNILDVGCGRADFLDHLLRCGVRPAHYAGIEAVDALVDAARRKARGDCIIIHADFVREPSRFLVGADVITFSGSLNTLDDAAFYATLQTACDAATHAVVFNFLSSSFLAAAEWLRWRRTEEVLDFARRLTPHVAALNDYLQGDTTIAMHKPRDSRHQPPEGTAP